MRHEQDNVMARHQVRRVPVVENGTLVGIVAQVDIARTENETGQPVEAISEPSEGERRYVTRSGAEDHLSLMRARRG
jgi:CBS-domain-containing membrane protein